MSRPRRPAPARRTRHLLALVLLALVGALALAAPAGAHAVVVAANPADQSRVTSPPGTVQVTFSERVTVDLGGLTVLDRNGRRVDEGPVSTSNGEATIGVALEPGLPDGTYVTNYQVISGDGHPVSGAIVWGIGSGPLADVSSLKAATSTGDEAFGGVARFLAYVGALLAAGLAVFARFVHDGGGDRHRLGVLTQIATAVAGIGIVSTIAAQVLLATGEGLGAIADLENLRKALDGGLGWQSVTLLVAMAALYVSGLVENKIVGQVLAFYGAIAVAVALVFWGHTAASPRPWVAIPADIVHVLAALIWFGGLVGMVVVLRGRSRLDPDELPADRRDELLGSTIGVVSRFSTVAAISTVALLLAGVALTIATTRTFGQLLDMTWGRVLLAKVAVVAVILFIAGYNRFRLLPWLLGPADDEDEPVDDPEGFTPLVSAEPSAWQHLLTTVRVEALGVLLVLALTAVLVNLTPDASARAEARPFNETKNYARGTVTLVITPALSGETNAIHVNLATPEGRPGDALSITAQLSQPAAGIAQIDRPLLNAGTGHFLLENMNDFTVKGIWTVGLAIRSDEFQEQTVTFQVPIG